MPTLTPTSPAPWRTLLFVFLFLSIASLVQAMDDLPQAPVGAIRPFDDIDRLAASLAVLSLADYHQSYTIFETHPTSYESNPLLSRHPSRRELLLFGVTANIMAYQGARFLSPRNGKLLMIAAVAIESAVVLHNAQKFGRWEEVGVAVPVVAFTFTF